MQKQKLIISYNDAHDEGYAEKLYCVIESNYPNYSLHFWNEKEVSKRREELSDHDKVIFLGTAPRNNLCIKEADMNWKFNKFGMKYGWKGNTCIITVNSDELSWKDFFGPFHDYCVLMNEKYKDVPIPEKSVFIEILKSFNRDDNASKNCQYSALLHEFYDGRGLDSFLSEANPSSSVFRRIITPIPYNKQPPSSFDRLKWHTIESRRGYKMQSTDPESVRPARQSCCGPRGSKAQKEDLIRTVFFRIIDDNQTVIAWSKKAYENVVAIAFQALFEEKILNLVDVEVDGEEIIFPPYGAKGFCDRVNGLINDAYGIWFSVCTELGDEKKFDESERLKIKTIFAKTLVNYWDEENSISISYWVYDLAKPLYGAGKRFHHPCIDPDLRKLAKYIQEEYKFQRKGYPEKKEVAENLANKYVYLADDGPVSY